MENELSEFCDIVLAFEGGYQCFKEDVANKNSKGELVGTNKGITPATYELVFKKCPSTDDIKNLKNEDFKYILKSLYWDRWKADLIKNKSIKFILVDWVWGSGKWGIIIPQRILGVVADGVVGQKTIDAVNNSNQSDFHDSIRRARIKFIDDIIANNPSQKKFENGWKNRVNKYKFIDERAV